MISKTFKYISIMVLSVVVFCGCGETAKTIVDVAHEVQRVEKKLNSFKSDIKEKQLYLEKKSKEMERQYYKVIEQNEKLMEELDYFKNEYLAVVADKDKAEKELKFRKNAYIKIYD